jgi:isocitrate/isopropylmalate dehydrogenase
MGAILTVAMMLRHLGMDSNATKIENAVLAAVHAKKTTQDVGGALGTKEVGQWIAERVGQR